MHLSIRWRLTLWYVLALAIVLIAFSALVYGLLANALQRRVDHVLMTESEEAREHAAQDLPDWIRETYEHEKVACVIYDGAGSVLLDTPTLSPASLISISRLTAGRGQAGDIYCPELGHQRFLVRSIESSGKKMTAVLLASLAEIDASLEKLLSVLWIAIPGSVLAAGALGYLMAKKALLPMVQLHDLTETITADRLDRRLPPPKVDDEVGQLTTTINGMIARLERSFAEIRRFTADASHELRTPLTVIRTEAEVALRQPPGTGEYQQLLGSILEECDRLTRLTDQLLFLSREDARPADRPSHAVRLSALLADVTETMRPLAETKALNLEHTLKDHAQIRGDESRLRQVFYNLLDNAIKYTPAGGTVTVESAFEDHHVIVTVRDTGIGIPSADLPHVFDRFYRVDKARNREQGGTGLGLSIARSIVETHGGSIELMSEAGRGTTCTVKLPLLKGASDELSSSHQ
jgi:heavy metal sensor kinase